MVPQKNSEFHQAEQGFAFVWLPFGLIWGRALVITRMKLPLVSILSPCFPSQKCFLRRQCTASHLALLRSSLPEHLQLTMEASHAQRALPLLRYLWQLALWQRPRTKAAASLPWTEWDLLVSGSWTPCPWEGCSAETQHTYSLLTWPADLLSVRAPLGTSMAADTFLLLGWFCTSTASVAFIPIPDIDFCREEKQPCVYHPAWQTWPLRKASLTNPLETTRASTTW